MRTLLNIMKKRKNEWIPQDKLAILESIIDTYYVAGRGSKEGDEKFLDAIFKHFNQEQRFRLWEQDYGGCRGTGANKERKEFALAHADLPLSKRLELAIETFEKDFRGKALEIILDEKSKTITLTFACDECYKHAPKEKFAKSPLRYYEACSGGRKYVFERVLGIKLRIKSVDVPSIGVNRENPCVFTYEILD